MMKDLDIQWLIAGVTVLLICAAGIGAFVVGLRSRARDQILAYLRSNGYKMVSLEGIRKSINPRYTDKFLLSLPDYFPNTLRRARLRDIHGELTIVGLARVAPHEDYLEEPASGGASAPPENP